ncbi:MAG: hypothetical protein CM1200mP41_26810 [Gammaproteobacteria bacterium]|nr:MAG: hypothetical protein CM1200mP41_26810 [Gammaproteobacteria bacterium]
MELFHDYTRRFEGGRTKKGPKSKSHARQLISLKYMIVFSVTELVTMEDLYISAEGDAINDVRDGFYDADGKVPCQIDGGLKCFGHPIGASGYVCCMRSIFRCKVGRGRVNVPRTPFSV